MRENNPKLFFGTFLSLLLLFTSQIADAQKSKNELIHHYLTSIRSKNTVNEKLPILQEAIEVFTQRNDLKSIAGFYREKGFTFSRNEQLDSSLVAYEKAINICESIPDSAGLAKALVAAGGTLMELNRYNEARTYCQRGLNIRVSLGDTLGVTSAMNSIGITYQYEGNLLKAQEVLREVLERSVAVSKDYTNQTRILTNLGVNAKTMGQYETALSYLKRARSLTDSLNGSYFSMGKVHIYNMMGSVYYHLGMYDLSVRYLDSLRHEADSINVTIGKRMYLVQMGRITSKLEDRKLTNRYYDELKALLPVIDSPEDSAIVYNNLGKLYAEEENFTLAKENYLHAIEIYQRLKDKPSLSSSYQLLGELYATHQMLDKAKGYIEQSATIAKEINQMNWPIIAYGSLGVALLESGYFKAAIPLLHQAEIVADSLGLKRELHDIYEYLVQAYDTTGNETQALVYSHKVLTKEKELQNIRTATAIAEANATYGISKFKKDLAKTNVILAQEIVVRQQEQIKRRRTTIIALIGIGLLFIITITFWQLAKLRRKRNNELQNYNSSLNEKNTHLTLQAQLIQGQKEIIQQNNLTLTEELETVKTNLDKINLVQNKYIQLKNKTNIRPLTIFHIEPHPEAKNNIKVYSERYPGGLKDRQTLSSILNQLPGDYFVKINKSSIINLGKIREVRANELLTNNNQWLKISPNFKEEFERKRTKFLLK